MKQIAKSLKAIRDLGLPKLWYYTLYQIGLRLGYYRYVTPSQRDNYDGTPQIGPYPKLPQVSSAHANLALAEAQKIQNGRVRLFGGDAFVPLNLALGASDLHWSALEKSPPKEDIKFIWEQGRFGWAVTLARAYAFSSNLAIASDFWNKTLQFLSLHPPNLGRQWQSGQEVAIRLMVLVFCDRVFANAPTSTQENRRRLWQAIAEHANRIPSTLIYARAQNNNHLIAEAAGLYTAGLYLSDHPQAQAWRQKGWRWLNWAIQNQINEFGTFVQHSVNYHRLMLQLALYTNHLSALMCGPDWPIESKNRLEAATRWLWALTDPETGQVPNLGANDGALILPLSSTPFRDFRPVVDAAAKAFLKQDVYAQPQLAEMSDWFGVTADSAPDQTQPQAFDILRIKSSHGRAFLRSAYFYDRPSHADQLHVDLWWLGVNVALDPGTFQYNAAPPWDNALAGTAVHNTLMIDEHNQMLRAGRFLWLDWAQAEVLMHEIDENGHLFRVTAEHNGYRKLGVLHQRTLQSVNNGFRVMDSLLPYGQPSNQEHTACLSWLLPDWSWSLISEHRIRVEGPGFAFQLLLEGTCELNLYRAGEQCFGELPGNPTWGWTSPTYAVKKPALMVVARQTGKLPMNLQSYWQFDPSP